MTDLYDAPLARHDHPQTSHDAAEAIRPLLAQLHAWTAECVTASPGLTARELAERYCPTDPRKIGRRLVECERLQLIRRGPERKCRVSGRPAATWEAVRVG